MAKHSSTAKVVDGSLVLSLPDAVTPVVMRLSLEEAKSAAFTVLEKKDLHVLTVQFSEKESRDIAPFADKDQAVSALMAASAALEKGSRVYSANAGSNDNEGGFSFKTAGKWVAALGLLFILVWFVASMNGGVPQAPSRSIAERAAGGEAAANGTGRVPFDNPRQVTGAPVSADDFLSRAE